MDTIRRGNAAEAAVLNAMVRADLDVYLPFGDGSACDLVVDTEFELINVQVKSARVRGQCIEFNSASTDHGNGRRDYVGRADVFAVHAHQLDRVYIVPVERCGRMRGYLRCAPARNNQRKGVLFAGDYSVERWAASLTRAAA